MSGIKKINDVLFIIDATGSMGSAIRAAHARAADIARKLTKTHADTDFKFGCICYRDPIDWQSDQHQVHDFDSNIQKMVKFLSTVVPTGGGDSPEDWVGAYRLALCDVNWRDGAKTIIHIADANAHCSKFCGYNNHEEEAGKLEPLVFELASMRAVICGMNMNNGASISFEQCRKIYEHAKGPKYSIEPFSEHGANVEKEITKCTEVACEDAMEEWY
ncbi:hypothetical protein TRFO_20351 [Tritrichomonas foetus]|uniref:Hemicentin-1-like von Willebrand factor A domain-containing protein n=1 Tax=Tritrichomonas foetus TaxID=1144522 RepID=A0A1J4KLY9_9EUKA|nr:hypothetical protein TRFO_20351 [Tritrichomonas foetus]|eukprot:OHT10389.1 hypothetical protein TRFO_20351 [Tritrichomonas foetus]